MKNTKPNINAVLACAMVEKCTIQEAARKVDAPHEVMFDAVCLRMSVAVDQNITDYHESIYAAFKRLEEAN
jgi:hypothetical protein